MRKVVLILGLIASGCAGLCARTGMLQQQTWWWCSILPEDTCAWKESYPQIGRSTVTFFPWLFHYCYELASHVSCCHQIYDARQAAVGILHVHILTATYALFVAYSIYYINIYRERAILALHTLILPLRHCMPVCMLVLIEALQIWSIWFYKFLHESFSPSTLQFYVLRNSTYISQVPWSPKSSWPISNGSHWGSPSEHPVALHGALPGRPVGGAGGGAALGRSSPDLQRSAVDATAEAPQTAGAKALGHRDALWHLDTLGTC